MKKTIFSILTLSFIALCFSMNLHAQSSEQDLDQVELMKQFIGTWICELGEDTTQIWEAIPLEKGYEINITWQAKGETYQTGKGIMGFAEGFRTITMYHLWPSGWISPDMGRFVSDKKLTTERFIANHKHVLASNELNFVTPDKIKVISKWRGMKETWDDAEVTEWIYTRVKE
jgi:hypothetical protein